MEGEVAVPQDFSMSVARDPMSVLAEAKRAAKALTDVVKAIPEDKKVFMGGEQYLEYEHWQLIARFYGCSAKVAENGTRYVEIAGARGFEASAVVLDRDGRIISGAEAMCLNDEEKWSARPKYEWQFVKKSGGLSKEDPGADEIVWEEKNGKRLPKKDRIKVGEVQVPLNQLRSMAQTRACAKGLRNVFAWVVVLAGYAPTTAEELTGHEQPPPDPSKPTVKQPTLKQAAQRAKPAQAATGDGRLVASGFQMSSETIARDGKKPWNKLIIDDGDWVASVPDFTDAGKLVQEAYDNAFGLKVWFKSDQYGNKIERAVIVEEAQPAE